MQKLMIIGNLTKEPELRTTTSGKNVCSFNVAVNRKKRKDEEKPEADYFRVTAWNELGEICAKYMSKGKKVCVVGTVSLHTYDNNGKSGASLEVLAQDVEFLSPKSESVDKQSGYQKAEPDDDFPY